MKTSGSEPEEIPDDEILPEYSLKGAVRGKYARYFTADTKVVVLDPDVADVFPDATSVNSALRALSGIIRERAQVPVG
ncbi:hypothetical protein [Longimicrobium sp.]|uniref:hypothetical protein n=1 Tax=Longimicrobium sp. TaxID=2029185 RepID=UPI002D05D011|nr:hypothetical protein [Longimicrobium sp.]HSU16933.1 hypothetical protein [Longimicrobium sp.]